MTAGKNYINLPGFFIIQSPFIPLNQHVLNSLNHLFNLIKLLAQLLQRGVVLETFIDREICVQRPGRTAEKAAQPTGSDGLFLRHDGAHHGVPE